MIDPGLAFVLASLMAAVHFLGKELEEYLSGYREKIVSFTSGASITYIFVELMPEFNRIASESTEFIFLFPLFGFSSIHLLEKYVAKSGVEQERMRKDYGEIHSIFLFIYYGALGYLIASLMTESAVSGLLFFLPIILHVAVSSFSVTELHESFVERKAVKIGISIAPLFGVALYKLQLVAEHHFNPVFGMVTGMFFYVAIRDSMPREDRGRPKEYIIGSALYLGIILIAKIV